MEIFNTFKYLPHRDPRRIREKIGRSAAEPPSNVRPIDLRRLQFVSDKVKEISGDSKIFRENVGGDLF